MTSMREKLMAYSRADVPVAAQSSRGIYQATVIDLGAA